MPSVPTFIINIERDLPRREHMQQQLAKVGTQAEFISAVVRYSYLTVQP